MLMAWTTPGTFPCITVLSLRGSWWRTWCFSPRYLDVPCGVPGRGLWNLRLCGDIIRSCHCTAPVSGPGRKASNFSIQLY